MARGTHVAMLALVLGACAAAPAGEARRGDVRLPSAPAVPVPMPGPDAAVRLTPDLLFVIDSDVPVLVLTSPRGLVAASEEKGPVKIRGRFVDDPGKTLTRTFKGQQVVTLEAAGTGRVEVLVVPVGAKSDADVIRRLIDVDAGNAPRPPPTPDPKPNPKPEPKVDPAAPIPAAGLRVLIVFETADAAKLTRGQESAIYAKATRELLNAKCAVGPDGKTKEWRIFDKDADAAADAKLWADAMKRPRTSLPWLIVSNGAAGFEGPLVDDAQVAELVKQYGG